MRQISLKNIIRNSAIVLAAFCLPYTAFSSVAQDIPSAQTPQTSIQTKPHETQYLLREYNGSLAVFRNDNLNNPYALYSVAVGALPDGDREHLKAGIIAAGEDELRQLLEDYTS